MTIACRWCVVLLVATMSNRPSSNGRQVASAVQKRTSVRSPAAVRASAILLRVDVDAYRAYTERIGDRRRRGAVAAADVQVQPAPLDRHVPETPNRFPRLLSGCVPIR